MTRTADEYWELIHAERARVALMLDGLTAQQWHADSLCGEWTVQQVVAHLTAAANTGRWAWLRSILFAGFNPDRHNARRLAEHLGRTVDETRENFRRSVTLTIAPTRDYPAWLGEVIVHGQDIARPLGITFTPDPDAVREVATYFAAKDFAVNSHRMVKGLTLEASDTDFAAGSGPLVRGPLLSLVMVMAGRSEFLTDVDDDGVAELRRRIG
ncbi:maleylpyruvate isomerase family mycothiol-dependent enzyme [Paramicrobacterium fandaimingii]|uniref:maleylpyruvate isomerase family mycothiol-dependent enzyme n=1 Tax=Paramicrobacterium fandaimingii TaxID=2708079 RepID=UPI0014225990|nr:maleylpyruvate isomerase family mycothiol-dependent enzyme [Microbacterium fandaimingii]